MGSIVFLNEVFVPFERARISPDDRGFYFADGIYEVVKYYRGKSLCFYDHLERLRRSITETRIPFDGFERLEAIASELIRLNTMENEYAGIYLQVTRGEASRKHRFPGAGTPPTVYMKAFPLPPFISRFKNGIRVILREDIRWQRCDIKSVMLLPNVMMIQEAEEEGAEECIFVRDGFFTECTHSNIFGVKDGAVHTFPESNRILSGITRKVILRLCPALGIPVYEEPIRADAYAGYDEYFITGTGNEVTPVVAIESKPVGDGRPGIITRQIQQEFFRMTYGEMAGDWSFRDWINGI